MTLDLHEDGLILCENGASLSHGSLSRVILSARAAWEVENDAVVVDNVRTASMIDNKSRVKIVCRCGIEAMGP